MHYYKQTRYKLLRTFCVVAQKENITHAAEQLHISQPTVSLQIQALEREVGETLLERRGPSIRLTPEGKVLYELVLPLTLGIDSLRENFAANLGKMDSSELNIAAGQTTSLYILPEYIQKFHDDYPGVRINLHNVSGQSNLKGMLDEQVDFGIGTLLNVSDGMLYKPVTQYRTVLIAAEGHPLTRLQMPSLQDIAAHGLILPPRHLDAWYEIDNTFRQQGVQYNVAMEAGGWEVVKHYVEKGVGVSIVSEVCLTGQECLVSMPLNEYFPDRSYGLILRKGKYYTPQAKRFLALFQPLFSEPLFEV